MTQFLPPNLLALFAPREPLTFLPPYGKLPHEKNSKPYTGVANYLSLFEDPKDTPPPTRVETRDERRERKRKERSEMVAYKLEQDLALWDPNSDPSIRGDPYKTLFIARINYDTTESKLRREFDNFGPIKQVHMIVDNNTGKPRGYAFIEYEHERDMHAAYKLADGKKIDGRRVLVDVERGRTVKGWRPRRLGGGLGSTRKGGTDENTKYSGRDDFDARERGGIPEDRVVRGDSRERDRDRDRDRRRRSPSRERHRSRDRKKRSREKIKRSPDIKRELEDATKINPLMDDSTRRRHRRSRSRDKDTKDRDKEKDRDRKRSRSRENRDRKRPKRSRSRDRHRGEKMVPKFKKEEPLDDGQAGIPLGMNGDNRRIKTETAEAQPDPEFNPYLQPPMYNQYNQQGYDQAYGQYNYGENQ